MCNYGLQFLFLWQKIKKSKKRWRNIAILGNIEKLFCTSTLLLQLRQQIQSLLWHHSIAWYLSGHMRHLSPRVISELQFNFWFEVHVNLETIDISTMWLVNSYAQSFKYSDEPCLIVNVTIAMLLETLASILGNPPHFFR